MEHTYFDSNVAHQDIEFVKGMKFVDCEELKHALKCYAVANGFKLKTIKSEKTRFLVRCFYNDVCEWRLYASPISTENSFQIKSLYNEHTCIKQYDAKIKNSTWLAREYAKKIRDCPQWKLREFQADVKEKYGLNVTLMQCDRAKKKALTEVEGALQQHYGRLFDYTEEIERSNPGSKVVIDIVPNLNQRVFRRFYVIFGGLKRGWIEHCRHVIGLDGCFLKGFCKGELLTAVGRDGNNQMFPIAWAIVEVENKDSWLWFLNQLIRDLGINRLQGLGRGWTIISDQQKGLIHAKQELLPHAEHRNCARHIYANFRKRHNGSKMRKIFWKASKCSTKEEFVRIMQQVKALSNDAYNWLMNQDPHLRSRAFFNTTTQCENVENNMSEAFNGFISEARHKAIINMLEDIRVALMVRVEKKLKEINKNPHDPICPRIREKLEANKVRYRHWTCSHNFDRKFEVKNGDIGYVVNMMDLTCSCRMWQLSGIPCTHAINAIYFLNDSPDKYVAHWFLKKTYIHTYAQYLQPMNGHNMWPISSIQPVLPPERRRLPGRPKKQRRLEFHEGPRPNKVSRKGQPIKCTKCHQFGLNKATCENQTVLIIKDPPKPKGRPKKPPPLVTSDGATKKTMGRNKKKRTDFGFGVYTDPNTGVPYTKR